MPRTYQEQQQAEAARQAKVTAAQQQRLAELSYFERVEAERQQQRAASQQEDAAFQARVAARREAEQAAIERGEELPAPAIPTFNDLYQAKATVEREAEAEAERQREAAITPAQIWRSTLPYREQQRIAKWEGINQREYPFELAKGQ